MRMCFKNTWSTKEQKYTHPLHHPNPYLYDIAGSQFCKASLFYTWLQPKVTLSCWAGFRPQAPFFWQLRKQRCQIPSTHQPTRFFPQKILEISQQPSNFGGEELPIFFVFSMLQRLLPSNKNSFWADPCEPSVTEWSALPWPRPRVLRRPETAAWFSHPQNGISVLASFESWRIRCLSLVERPLP